MQRAWCVIVSVLLDERLTLLGELEELLEEIEKNVQLGGINATTQRILQNIVR